MPQRIGELLVAQGLVTDQDLRDVLVYARQRSMRLCSALVAKGRLLPDDASRALADQHGVHAALVKHLDGRDMTLATKLPPQLARDLVALPLALARDGAMVVCVRDPGPGSIVALEAATGRRIILAVAVECLLSPLVQDVYAPGPGPDIDDGFDVDLDSAVDHVPPVDPLDTSTMQLVDLDDHGVEKDHFQSTGGDRNRVGPAFFPVGTEPGTLPPTPPVGGGTGRRTTGPMAALPAAETGRASRSTGQLSALAGVAPPPLVPPRSLALDPTLVALVTADSRDAVMDTLIAYLRHRFACGLVFVIKDGMALGVDGFATSAIADAVEALVVPLNQPSVLRAAYDKAASFIGAPPTASVIQDRMFKVLGSTPDRVVVVPIKIKERVVNLIYGHDARRCTLEEAAVELGTVADAAEEAFVRIILEAKGA